MTEILLESKNNTEAVFKTKTGEDCRLPLTLLPVNVTVGQKMWLTISETESVKTSVSPQDILNELLRSDESTELKKVA